MRAASIGDCLLPTADRLLPQDRLWSAAGLQRYLDGHRPDPADVFRRLVAVLNHFVDFSDSPAAPAPTAELLATYLLTTWFTPAFPALGLLWIVGDHGAGKSRLLHLLAHLAHLGVSFPGLPSSAVLRDLAGLGASLAVDDAHFFTRGSLASLWGGSGRPALLLAGRQRGGYLAVSQSGGARHTRLVDVSGPRLFACSQLPLPGIAAYFIIVPIQRSTDAARATADPADPAAWPASVNPRDLVDDLWALALSRLRDLRPHLALAAAQATRPGPIVLGTPDVPLPGADLQPWRALLAVASWLSSASPSGQGVPGLLDRLLALARAYHAARPAFQSSDQSVLALSAVVQCVSTQIADLNTPTPPADDGIDGNDGIFENDANDGNDGNSAHDAWIPEGVSPALMENFVDPAGVPQVASIRRSARPLAPRIPSIFKFTSAQVLLAMRRCPPHLQWNEPSDHLTPAVVGRLLGLLGLQSYRNAILRTWRITPAELTRLARAYGLPLSSHLAAILASSAAKPPSPDPQP
jgi:hypothetical protein